MENAFGFIKKFIIYLPNYYFKQTCCGRCNCKLIENLNLRGVRVLSFENIQNNYLYDDSHYREVNILYIWLTDNKYYSDRIFSKKKTELEREMLFLLTGILGGSKISCTSYVKENNSLIMNQNTSTGLVEESVNMKQINSASNSIEKNEIYDNTGSPILLTSETWEDLKIKIHEYFSNIDKKTIVSYNYFKNNSDLLIFVFKRFKFKLLKYHYKIDEDRSCEKSIQVRIILKGYGLSGELESKHSESKMHLYDIEFYTMEELKKIYDTRQLQIKKKALRDQDIFSKLRYEYELNNILMKEIYSDWGGDEKPIYEAFINYVKELNILDKLNKWIEDNDQSKLNGQCHWFKSKSDVDYWLNENLKIKIN